MKKRVNHKSGEPADGENRAAGDNQFAVALYRGLEILRCFQPDGAPLDEKEIAARAGLTKPSAARLIATLTGLGCLERRASDGKYRLGFGALGLGYVSLAGLRIVDAVAPFMDELAQRAGEGIMVALGLEDDLSMLYLACTQNAGLVTLQMRVGSRISLTRSSMGRAYVAGLTPPARDALLERVRARVGDERWPDTLTGLNQASAEIAGRGFCVNTGHWRPDVHSVGAPFNIGGPDMPPFAFNCGGPSYLAPRERLENELGPQLADMARRLTGLCVGRAASPPAPV